MKFCCRISNTLYAYKPRLLDTSTDFLMPDNAPDCTISMHISRLRPSRRSPTPSYPGAPGRPRYRVRHFQCMCTASPTPARVIADLEPAPLSMLVRQVRLPQRSSQRGPPHRPHPRPLLSPPSLLPPFPHPSQPLTAPPALSILPSRSLPPSPRSFLHPPTLPLDALWRHRSHPKRARSRSHPVGGSRPQRRIPLSPHRHKSILGPLVSQLVPPSTLSPIFGG